MSSHLIARSLLQLAKTMNIRGESSFADTGATIVLLHGYPFDRSMWDDQVAFLSANGFRAIAPDLRGFGAMSDKLQFVDVDADESKRQAEARRTIITMTDIARDIGALIDELKLDRVVVCGLSMGGYVALEFAKLFPARLSGLVLAGTRAPADNEAEKQGREEQVKQILAEGMNGIAEASLPKLLAPATIAKKAEVAARLRQIIRRADPAGAAAAQRGMAARRDYSADLTSIDTPTLVIVGRDDPIRPVADAEFMHQRIRNSRLEIIEDAAHMTNMEQPEVFNRILVDFLKSFSNTAGAGPPS